MAHVVNAPMGRENYNIATLIENRKGNYEYKF